MNKAYIKCYIQKRIPSIRFESADQNGVQHPEHHVHCVVSVNDLHALDCAVTALGKTATWPLCPNIGGQHRVIEV